jgi:hypothetical protein
VLTPPVRLVSTVTSIILPSDKRSFFPEGYAKSAMGRQRRCRQLTGAPPAAAFGWSAPPLPGREAVSNKETSGIRPRRLNVHITEWRAAEGGKQPYAIARQDGQPMAFAGLWESFRWQDETVLRTFTIMTTTPNAEMSDLHDRMPVIPNRQDWPAWLGEVEGDCTAYCVLLRTDCCVCGRSIGALAHRGTTDRSCWNPSPYKWRYCPRRLLATWTGGIDRILTGHCAAATEPNIMGTDLL